MKTIKTIKGKYEKDNNFTTIYCNNTIYTIARNGKWGCKKVGENTGFGKLTQEIYDKWESECTKEGTFVLE